MSTYLGRLKSVLAENTPTPLTDKTDKRASVSFVSGEGRHVSRGTPGTVGTPATARRSYPDIPDEWSEAIEQLLSRPCPEAESAERWASACRGVEQFAQQWGAKALSLGWTFEDLFAFAEPFANISLQGAAWFVGASTVTAVTADAITLRTESGATQRIYRKPCA